MPTKSQYREYIASEEWQERRKKYLVQHPRCMECGLPRWLAIVAYDQDLHVHHRSYARVGHELDEDLQALCRSCHEIKTFGNTALHAPKRHVCVVCGMENWDGVSRYCDPCRAVFCDFLRFKTLLAQWGPENLNWPVWHEILACTITALAADSSIPEAIETIKRHLAFEEKLRDELEKLGEEERTERGDS